MMTTTPEAFLKISKYLVDEQIGAKQAYILAVLSNSHKKYTLKKLLTICDGSPESIKSALYILRKKGLVEYVLNFKGTGSFGVSKEVREALFKDDASPDEWTREDYEANRADLDNKIAQEH